MSLGHRFRRARALTAVVVLAGIAATAGCTERVQADPAATAKLDYKAGTITYPVSEYRLSRADVRLVAQARETLLARCMRERGFPAEDSAGSQNTVEERPYGIWVVDLAKRYGFSAHPVGDAPSAPAISAQPRNESDPAWQKARGECVATLSGPLQDVTPPEMNPPAKLVSEQVRAEAYAQASSSAAWKQAREDYWSALKRAGLTPDRSGSGWSSQEAKALGQTGTDKEREIKIATQEAQCNNEVHLTQRLADLESSFQAPLVKKNQAALNEEKTTNATILAKAREAVARG